MEVRHWFVSFYLLIVSSGFSQNQQIPLADYLTTIETTFNVKFSYSVNDVTNIYITRPSETLDLKSTLD